MFFVNKAIQRDKWFLGMAKYVASASKDPSTKVGSVIVRPDHTVASLGYNGFPRGIYDDPKLYADREEKYKRIIHADMNAVLNAREVLAGYTMYVWPMLPCENCAKHLIQISLKRIVSSSLEMVTSNEMRQRWEESNALAKQMFREAGVEIKVYDQI